MNAPENPPAFPVQDHVNEWGHALQPGMTLRDWFAGQALGHILAAMAAGDYETEADTRNDVLIARHSYAMADAMLAARGTGGAA